MTDRPIIFSAPMVRALLEDRKTQTRRVLNGRSGIRAARSILQRGAHWLGIEYDRSWPLRMPYAPGDRLWVREAFIGHYAYEVNEYPPRDWGNKPIWFPADGPVPEKHAGQFWHRARPSIHMPRWASRLTLIVTDVRVQRLQEISEADAVAEGAEIAKGVHGPDGGVMVRTDKAYMTVTPYRWFRELWNSIHGHEAWDQNPWVAAISFRVIRANIDSPEAAQ